MEQKDKNYQNILLVALGALLLAIVGNEFMGLLHFNSEQMTALWMLIIVLVIVFGVIMAIRINRKEDNNGE